MSVPQRYSYENWPRTTISARLTSTWRLKCLWIFLGPIITDTYLPKVGEDNVCGTVPYYYFRNVQRRCFFCLETTRRAQNRHLRSKIEKKKKFFLLLLLSAASVAVYDLVDFISSRFFLVPDRGGKGNEVYFSLAFYETSFFFCQT